LAAFVLASELEPVVKAEPYTKEDGQPGELARYAPMLGPNGNIGMKIQAINLSYRYPGAKKMALHNINLVRQG
jgi:hypothetical protein